ncbi:FxSxx-COOH system tetratricopeptide repeat protein [Streptomyces griseicoloratus]|uniref:FxSxx-COOH system tetratricopeptide repeat protein n=1 Tax=Streptomyces griseicoloratus TaxID=2752516 RepID=UPI00281181B1|nr:FxSxx-COOH system tetratricopeptide repeat protein [Streptomyces griseicoloratus]
MTLSFAGFNRAWASWIGSRLERRGHRVVLQRWDLRADVPLADLLRDLKLADGRILLVISEWYFQLGSRTQEEWNLALHEVVAPDPSRFAAVSVSMTWIPTAIARLAPADFTNVDAVEAERRLLERLDLPADPFPGSADGDRRGPRYPADMPEIWGAVPRRNTRFAGRGALLTEMYSLLQGAEPGAGVLTLHGMSGVGKTQLAVEYVHRFGAEYDVVWWADAARRTVLRRTLAELAPRLGLSVGAEYGERLRAVRDSLRRGDPYARWLLVLDAADEPEELRDLVPTGPGHVLITSRNPGWGGHNSRLLEVPVYDRKESVAFVRSRAPRLTDAEADQLAAALEDLPLLLDQTARWLDDSHMPVHEYLGLLEGGVDEDTVKVSADFPVAFRTAWSILLNSLRETAPDSVDLLRLCTFFAPGSIPVPLLRQTSQARLPGRLAALLDDPVLWNKAINQLRQYSVVRLERHEPASGATAPFDETLYLHRMVHQLVRNDMPEEERHELGEAVRTTLAAAVPGRPTDPRVWPDYEKVLPHLTHADVLQSKDPLVQRLVLNCLRYTLLAGKYTAGTELGERAVQRWRSLLGESHPCFSELTYRYADLLRAAGDHRRAETTTRAAVERLREERGGQDLHHLRAVGGRGADLWALGRYDEARELTQQVLTEYRSLCGDQDARTLHAQHGLAVSLRLLGRYAEALESDGRTLRARRALLTARHPWTLFSAASYAIDHRLTGRVAEAVSLQTENVRECRVVMGTDHPHTLRAEHNLALCLYADGAHDRAGQLLHRVLEQAERVLGPAHPYTLVFAMSQSCFARVHGDVDQAHAASESIVARCGTMFGEDHPYSAGARSNQALVLRSVGERQQAHTLIEQALAGLTAAVGERHPWTLGCAVNASALRGLVGDDESAAALGVQTVTRATETLGRTHPLTLSARLAYAADLRSLRNRLTAEQVEAEALADLTATLGARHAHTLAARSRARPYWDFEPEAL